MADNSDEILRTYIENVLRLQQERDRNALSDDELRQIALDSGMTESDLAYVRQRLEDCLDRGKGFIRYENVIKGDSAEQHPYCGSCNHAWAVTGEGSTHRTHSRPPEGSRAAEN